MIHQGTAGTEADNDQAGPKNIVIFLHPGFTLGQESFTTRVVLSVPHMHQWVPEASKSEADLVSDSHPFDA